MGLSSDRASNEILPDDEFGQIRIVRRPGRTLRASVRTNGDVVISVPTMLSRRDLAEFIASARPQLRRSLELIGEQHHYANGDKVGRRHILTIKNGVRDMIRVTASRVTVTLSPSTTNLARDQLIRQAVCRALKYEASRHLPHRLYQLADKFGYHYSKVRLTFAKSRWGSCSSNGTISLNVALMTLPDELIDYVLLHELAHTKQMNHSAAFWAQLESTLPNYQNLRRRMKQYSPYI